MSKSTKAFSIVILQHLIISELTAVNVALRKSAKYCSVELLSDIMFDGVKDYDKVEAMKKPCTERAFVEVQLDGSYEVHYVVVYGGKIGKGTGGKQLDFFEVRLEKGACSSFPGLSSNYSANRGMRVNCDSTENKSSSVTIESRQNEGLYISEIEVHTFSSGVPGEKSLIYRGCFSDFASDENGTKAVNDPLSRCRQMCDSQLFCAIKANSWLHCGNEYDDVDEMPVENCNLTCKDSTKVCGGKDAYSIYFILIRLPIYFGCLKAVDQPDSTTITDDMTIQKCLHHCDNFHFALLMDGNFCFCNRYSYLSNILRYNKCTSRCSGDTESFCGGNGYISLYRTCLKPFFGSLACSKSFNCAGPYDKYGDCGGSCKPGFIGDHCLERDKKYGLDPCRNSDPCGNKTNTMCFVRRGMAKCECMYGYSMNESLCEDINECIYEACDTRYSSCLNLNGSYICRCKPGYNATISSDVCVASDSSELYRFSKLVLLMNLHPILIILPFSSTLVFLIFARLFHAAGSDSDSDAL